MQETATQPYPPRFKHLKRWSVIFAVFVVLLILARWQWGRIMDARLEAFVQSIEAKDEPIRFSDIQPQSIPDTDNAAYYYEQALANWPRVANNQLITETPWNYDQHAHPDPITDNSAYLKRCAGVFDLLDKAANAPGYSTNRPLNTPVINTLFSNLGEQRKLARLIEDAVNRALDAGQHDIAINLIDHLFQLADTSENQPYLFIDFLIGISIQAIATHHIEENLPRLSLEQDAASNPATPDQLHKLINRLLTENWHEKFIRAWIHDRWCAMDTINAVFEGKLRVQTLRAYPTSLQVGAMDQLEILILRPWYTADALQAMESLTSAIDFLKEPKPAPVAFKAYEHIDTTNWYTRGWKDYVSPFSANMLTGYVAGLRTFYQYQTFRKLTATALAIKLYEHDHGQRPTTLDELVPDYLPTVPIDPMAADGRPIAYLPDGVRPRLQSHHWFTPQQQAALAYGPYAILYSVGGNGTDDGGAIYFDSDGTFHDNLRYNDNPDNPSDFYFLLDPQPQQTISPQPTPMPRASP